VWTDGSMKLVLRLLFKFEHRGRFNTVKYLNPADKQCDQICAKFHHFDATIYNFGHFEKVHLLLDKNFSLLRQIWAKVQCCEWPNIEPIH